jgi:hypothetical protein
LQNSTNLLLTMESLFKDNQKTACVSVGLRNRVGKALFFFLHSFFKKIYFSPLHTQAWKDAGLNQNFEAADKIGTSDAYEAALLRVSDVYPDVDDEDSDDGYDYDKEADNYNYTDTDTDTGHYNDDDDDNDNDNGENHNHSHNHNHNERFGNYYGYNPAMRHQYPTVSTPPYNHDEHSGSSGHYRGPFSPTYRNKRAKVN